MDLLLQGLRCPLKVNEGRTRAWHRRGRAAAAWSWGCHDAFGSPAMVWGGVGEELKVQRRLCSQEAVKGLLRGLFSCVSVRSVVKVGLCLCKSFLVRKMSFTT